MCFYSLMSLSSKISPLCFFLVLCISDPSSNLVSVTLISTSIVAILIFLEFMAYLTPNLTEDLFVDTTRTHKLRINVDITLHNLACNYVSLDAMDSSGDQHLRVDHDIFKHRLDLQGNPLKETEPIKEIVAVSPSTKNSTCGSCYGAEFNSTQ